MKKLLSYFIVFVLSLSALTGCAAPKPSETVDAFLKAIKEQDSSKVSNYYAGSDFSFNTLMDEEEEDDVEDDPAYTELLENTFNEKMLDFDYVIGEEKIDGDKATVVVSFTTYNLGSAYTLFFSDYLTKAFSLMFSDVAEDELDKIGIEILNEKLEGMTKSYTKDVTFNLTKKDKAWVLDEFGDDTEFYDVLLGGFFSEIENLANSFNEDVE